MNQREMKDLKYRFSLLPLLKNIPDNKQDTTSTKKIGHEHIPEKALLFLVEYRYGQAKRNLNGIFR